MGEYIIKFHPDFFKDLDKLSKKEIEIFEKKKEKIRQNPLRSKHLSGGDNCYREAITDNIRLVYWVIQDEIWMLIIDKHDPAYEKFRKRLYSLKVRYLKDVE